MGHSAAGGTLWDLYNAFVEFDTLSRRRRGYRDASDLPFGRRAVCRGPLRRASSTLSGSLLWSWAGRTGTAEGPVDIASGMKW